MQQRFPIMFYYRSYPTRKMHWKNSLQKKWIAGSISATWQNELKREKLYNYIINKEEKIPKEFENLEVQILDVLEKYEMIYPEEIINCMKAENVEKVKVISYSLALAIKENVGYLLYKMNREQIISLYDESKIRENEYKGTDKEIQSFTNYYYKSLKGQLLKGRDPSFFVSKNEENQSKLLEEDEEGEEI